MAYSVTVTRTESHPDTVWFIDGVADSIAVLSRLGKLRHVPGYLSHSADKMTPGKQIETTVFTDQATALAYKSALLSNPDYISFLNYDNSVGITEVWTEGPV